MDKNREAITEKLAVAIDEVFSDGSIDELIGMYSPPLTAWKMAEAATAVLYGMREMSEFKDALPDNYVKDENPNAR